MDRAAFDRIIQAGGYISVNAGQAPDGNAIPIEKDLAEGLLKQQHALVAGACVAAHVRMGQLCCIYFCQK
ncbi:MAG: hypothetical protein R2774_05250 [Saprospiraceae bacterium]